jgi:hypothetical protein
MRQLIIGSLILKIPEVTAVNKYGIEFNILVVDDNSPEGDTGKN